MSLFDRFRKKPAESDVYIAAEHTNVPLDTFMTRLMAEELPMLDSADRNRVYRILEEYDGSTITTQDELPEEIREIMDL